MNNEEMKDNHVPWKWLDGQSRAFLLAAKKHNAMVFMDKNGWWQKHQGQESMGCVYRISKHYQEKPSYPALPNRKYDPAIRHDNQTIHKFCGVIDCLESIYERLEKLEAHPC